MTPPINAFKFTAYNQEFALFTYEGLPNQWELRCEAKNGDVWDYVLAPNCLKFGVNTKEEIDNEFIENIEAINNEIFVQFGGAKTTEPETGIERVQWLIDNKLKVENNKLVVL